MFFKRNPGILITLVLLVVSLTGISFFISCAGDAVPVSGGMEESSTTADTEAEEDAADKADADKLATDEAEDAKEESAPTKAAESKESTPAWSEGEGDKKAEAVSGKTSSDTESLDTVLRARTPGKTAVSVPSISGLKAGFADDNRQFNYFLSFLDEYGDVEHFPMDIEERIIFKISDSEGKSLPNADVAIYSDRRLLTKGKTYADGSFLFFPKEYGDNMSRYQAEVTFNQQRQEREILREGPRNIEIAFPQKRPVYQDIPLDILFILDTTGSMGEEIERLKTTIEIINANLAALSSQPRVRFGMVLYKDRDDEYRTRVIPFTEDMDKFKTDLNMVYASGGGDYPEDLQAALKDAVKAVSWNRDGIRLSFIITDATAHLTTYNQSYTYVDASKDAKARAMKIFSVGTGGLDISGEYVLRQISQYTSAKYIFLTYGEQAESEGGAPGSVSHHTGANYQTDKLETIIIRFAKEELSHLTKQPLEEEEDYYQAVMIEDETREETLSKLFDDALTQLVDYSAFKIKPESLAAVLPIQPVEPPLAANAEYFTDHLTQSLAGSDIFKGVERKDLQAILGELELQLSDLVDNAPEIGKLLEAEMLIAGKLYKKKNFYELFLKLLRVETGEILSVSRAKIDVKLGL